MTLNMAEWSTTLDSCGRFSMTGSSVGNSQSWYKNDYMIYTTISRHLLDSAKVRFLDCANITCLSEVFGHGSGR